MGADFPSVDLDRCIGCGVCSSTCHSGAIELKEKDSRYVPPKDTDAMNKKILLARTGIGACSKHSPKVYFSKKCRKELSFR
jgi:ferredoxin